MGYDTNFNGKLLFKKELSQKELNELQKFMGADFREHPEWKQFEKFGEDLDSIDLEIASDNSGIQWNGTEKTYYMVECINLIIRAMQKKFKKFGLEGEMLAQGEDIIDRWKILINSKGFAYREQVIDSSGEIECPHCKKKFSI